MKWTFKIIHTQGWKTVEDGGKNPKLSSRQHMAERRKVIHATWEMAYDVKG